MPRRPVWPGSPALRAAVVGCLTALGVGLGWLWPALGRGQLLYRDFVQVPRPVLGVTALGGGGQAPRAVPLDAVTALLAPVVPSGVQQQLMLVGSVVLAGCGAAVLLRRHGALAAVTAAGLVTWSPYAAERLLLGQPPTLLGWAMVPWLVAAVRWEGPAPRRWLAVLLAALPAALTPWGGLVALGTVLVAWWTVARRPGRRAGEPWVLGALGALWCLPWVLAGVRGDSGAGETAGARAFAVRGDGLAGVLDVLGGGGVWAPAATPASRGSAAALAASASLLLLALVVVALPAGALPRWAARDGRRVRAVLLLALLLPPVGALGLASPLGLVGWAQAQELPGVGILRDTHRLLGLSTHAGAALVALGVAGLAGAVRGGGGAGTAARARAAACGAVLTALALAVLSCPDAPSRLHGAYRPVAFPAGWQEAVAQVGGRTTLVLPWQPFRRQAWVGPQPFLDPLPLALPGRVVHSRDLVVPRGGRTLVVGSGDRAAVDAWARGDLAAVRRLGVEAVVTWADTPGAVPPAPAGARRTSSSGPLTVWLLDGPGLP